MKEKSDKDRKKGGKNYKKKKKNRPSSSNKNVEAFMTLILSTNKLLDFRF